MAGPAYENVESVTDRLHYEPWAAPLDERPYADDRRLVVAGAIDAVEHTAPGTHVNLVTPEDQGPPAAFLFEALSERFEATVDLRFVGQCGCGGYVTRVCVSPSTR